MLTLPKVLVLLITIGVGHHVQSFSRSDGGCILLIGGLSTPNVEYYNPDGAECDAENVGTISTEYLDRTTYSSGCYLSDTQQVVIRESVYKPPVIYDLKDGTATALPLPFNESNGKPRYTWGSTSGSINPSTCLSCGGFDGGITFLNQCYQFQSEDPAQWKPFTSLPYRVTYAASVVLGGYFYLIGGKNETHSLNQVYRYDPSLQRWFDEQPMSKGRWQHSAAVFSATEFIVCGGYNYRKDCEVYDTVLRNWRPVGEMNVGRDFFSLVSYNSRVYAIGGYGRSGQTLDSVELYHQLGDSWTIVVPPLKHTRVSFVTMLVPGNSSGPTTSTSTMTSTSSDTQSTTRSTTTPTTPRSTTTPTTTLSTNAPTTTRSTTTPTTPRSTTTPTTTTTSNVTMTESKPPTVTSTPTTSTTNALTTSSTSTSTSSTTTTPTTTITSTTPTTTTTFITRKCILLIGGVGTGDVEYFHPVEGVECDVGAIGTVANVRLNETFGTSGCYLSDTEDIVIREADNPAKPPVLYDLQDGTAKELSLPYKSGDGVPTYVGGTTAAIISSTTCLSCGGFGGGKFLNNCYQYDASGESSWTPIPALPHSLTKTASIALDDNNFYVVGGTNESATSSNLYRYDVQAQSWQQMKSMENGRAGHAAAALSSTELMVCGGYTRRRDCVLYSSRQNRWREVGDLLYGREEFALVNLNGDIYAMGGAGETLISEKYDRTIEQWRPAKAIKEKRYDFVATVLFQYF